MKATPPTKRADVRRLIDAFYRAETRKQKLAILDRLDAIPPELRKWFAHRGVVMNPVRERAYVNYTIGQDLFVKAEREYWKHHHPGDFPNVSSMHEAFEPAGRAIERASKSRTPARTRSRAVDYTAAREQLEPYAAKGGLGVVNENEARMILGAIAFREGRHRDAIRYLEGPDSRGRGLLGSAYLALGKRSAAKDALRGDLRRGDNPTHRGFLAELDGEVDAAISAYIDGLDTELPTWRNYSAYRLKRLKVTRARVEAQREAARRAGKIVVESTHDFHAKFDEIADAIRTHQEIAAPRKPMAEAEITALRLPTLRRGKSPLVGVPRSMATILRYDRHFRLFADAQPLLMPRKPVDIDKLVRADLPIRLPASKPVWNDDPKLPACIGLSNPGDQRVFLYMGTPDEDGEYPIARYDDQPELWISAASLIHHVLDAAGDVVHCTVDFKAKLARAQKRNKQHREALSEYVDVDALLEAD